MRTLRFLLLPLLLSLPLASAGGYDASVDYLESDGSACWTSASSDGDSHSNDTWGWYWQESRTATSCADSFSYADASVRDDEGEVAHAHAGTRESSTDNHTAGARSSYDYGYGYESYQWSHDHDDHNATDEGRSAGVETREGSAAADDGCRSSSSYQGGYAVSSYGWNDDSGRTERGRSDSTTSSRCATSATLSREGESTTVTPYSNGCRFGHSGDYQTSRYDWSSTNSSYQSYANDQTRSEGCVGGASASTSEGALFAGQESECTYDSHSYGSSSGNSSYERTYGRSDCVHGILVVRGPDGMVLFLGDETSTWQSCTYTDGQPDCHEGQTQQRSVRLSWAHNPLGPQPVTVPLP